MRFRLACASWLVLSCCLMLGCSSTTRTTAWWDFKSFKGFSGSKPAGSAEKTARSWPKDNQTNAEKTSTAKKQTSTNEAAKKVASTKTAPPKEAAKPAQQVVTHDAATLALIENETRDFPPQERVRALETLKAVPQENVTAVLQVWKASIEQSLKQAQANALLPNQTAAIPPAFSNVPDGFNNPLGQTPANAMLGSRSPWSNTLPQSDSKTFQQNFPNFDQGNSLVNKPFQTTNFTPPPNWGGYSQPQSGQQPIIHTGTGNIQQPPDFQSFNNTPPTNQNNPYWQGSSNVKQPPEWANGQNATMQGRFNATPNQGQAQSTYPQWNNSTPPANTWGNPPANSWANPDSSGVDPQSWNTSGNYNSNASAINTFPPPGGIQQMAHENGGPLRVTPGPSSHHPIVEGTLQERVLTPGQFLPGFQPRDPFPAPRSHPFGYPPGNPQAAQNPFSGTPPTNQVAIVPTPNAPIMTGNFDYALTQLIGFTENEVAQLSAGPDEERLRYYIQRHVYLRLLYVMSGQTERALQPIPDIAPADQEFWTQVLWGVTNYFDSRQIPNPADRATQTLSQFNNALLRLKERAQLELKNVSFCHNIESYGVYEKFPRDEFTPGQQVLIYTEIGNFHSELAGDGRYRTLLKSKLQFLRPGPNGEVIEEKDFPATEDLCRNHRHDYFHSYLVEIPSRSLPGPQVLKLVVEDELSHKLATHTLNFTVR